MQTSQLSSTNLQHRDIHSDRASMEQRIESFRPRQPSSAPKLILSQHQQQQQVDSNIVPEVSADAFSATILRDSLMQHGSLVVRNLFTSAITDALREAADRVIDACADPNAESNHEPEPYFNPPNNLKTIMPNRDRELVNTRSFHRTSGSAMCVEAPSVAEALLDFYEDSGLREIVTDYLQEPPCLTVKKWVLRRSLLPVSEAGWHQDGAFMGTDINSVNMWLPLSTCGGDTGAPGMDVVPRRLYDIASAEGAQFEWSVSDSQVQSGDNSQRPISPIFHAGDAYFFDHFFLHRTQYRPDFSKVRYAVETWFFGESAFPKNQIPLAW